MRACTGTLCAHSSGHPLQEVEVGDDQEILLRLPGDTAATRMWSLVRIHLRCDANDSLSLCAWPVLNVALHVYFDIFVNTCSKHFWLITLIYAYLNVILFLLKIWLLRFNWDDQEILRRLPGDTAATRMWSLVRIHLRCDANDSLSLCAWPVLNVALHVYFDIFVNTCSKHFWLITLIYAYLNVILFFCWKYDYYV